MKAAQDTLSRFMVSWLVYATARGSFLIELTNNLLLQSTVASQILLNKRQQKLEHIWWEFYSAEAMINRKWMKLN